LSAKCAGEKILKIGQ